MARLKSMIWVRRRDAALGKDLRSHPKIVESGANVTSAHVIDLNSPGPFGIAHIAERGVGPAGADRQSRSRTVPHGLDVPNRFPLGFGARSLPVAK